jgi:hypothetical protein
VAYWHLENKIKEKSIYQRLISIHLTIKKLQHLLIDLNLFFIFSLNATGNALKYVLDAHKMNLKK